MIRQNFGIVDRTDRLSMSDLTAMAAVLQKHLNINVAPKWGAHGDVVAAFAKESAIPAHFIPSVVVDESEMPEGALGYHTDTLGQAQIFVSYQDGNRFGICKTLSHELPEAKCDYAGNRLVPSWHPITNEPCRILLEVCDPSEALDFDLDGWRISDFYFQEWFDQHVTLGIPYTFMNGISRPRTILQDGYVSFVDEQGAGWQLTWFGGPKPLLKGPFDWSNEARGSMSLREIVDQTTRIARKAA